MLGFASSEEDEEDEEEDEEDDDEEDEEEEDEEDEDEDDDEEESLSEPESESDDEEEDDEDEDDDEDGDGLLFFFFFLSFLSDRLGRLTGSRLSQLWLGSSGGRHGTGTRRCSGFLLRFGSGFTFLGTDVESPQHLPISYLLSEKERGT